MDEVIKLPTLEEWFLGSMMSPMMIAFISPSDRKQILSYYGEKTKQNPDEYLDTFTKLVDKLSLSKTPYNQFQAMIVDKYIAEFFTSMHMDKLKEGLPTATDINKLEFLSMTFGLKLFKRKESLEFKTNVDKRISELKGQLEAKGV